MRKKLIAANWKMHKTPEQAQEFVSAFLPQVAGHARDEIVLCPPFVSIPAVVEATRNSNVAVGGLSVAAAEKKIGGLLESGGYLKKAQVNIIVSLLASQQVSVLGQVNRPGRYPVDGKRSVRDMLAQNIFKIPESKVRVIVGDVFDFARRYS